MRLPFFSCDLLKHVDLKLPIGHHFLQPTVLLFQLPQALDVGDVTQERLERTDFYRLVGRDDLARRYERRRTIAIVGIAGGLALGLAGGLMYSGAKDPSSSTASVGVGLVGGGLVAIAVGAIFALRMDPVSEDEAHDLASDYNAQLRHDLRVAF